MDILLILYSLILAGFVIIPFLFVRINENNNHSKLSETNSSLHSERKMLLENLKDLKIEMDTGKIQNSEFAELSEDIISNLKLVDEELKSVVESSPIIEKGVCKNCKFTTNLVNAKFCAMCGNSLLA